MFLKFLVSLFVCLKFLQPRILVFSNTPTTRAHYFGALRVITEKYSVPFATNFSDLG